MGIGEVGLVMSLAEVEEATRGRGRRLRGDGWVGPGSRVQGPGDGYMATSGWGQQNPGGDSRVQGPGSRVQAAATGAATLTRAPTLA